ncbi:hypothetical protein OPW07_24250 [Vibrio europaeus]|uniref:hypothetical protein n=1 Tax=Vibrio europaeus TaxID=300876 RepID=UPI0018A7A640|nr:hypothetical protein [Vibrio europaeus]MDC5812836.1 hypothetical protein [Vibrio europaeus]QPG37630.1 hypothetical protein IXK98_15085 [Vibrio europaeus]
MSKHEWNSEEAKQAQLKGAKSRSENAKRRREVMALARKVSLKDLMDSQELNVNLNNEQKAEIKMHFLKAAMVGLAIENSKHQNKVTEMCVQNELDEMLKEQPSKRDISISGDKLSVADAIKSGLIDETRISLEDVNHLRMFVQ